MPSMIRALVFILQINMIAKNLLQRFIENWPLVQNYNTHLYSFDPNLVICITLLGVYEVKVRRVQLFF